MVGDEAFKTARSSSLSAFRFTLPRSNVTEKYPDFEILDRTQDATLGMVLAFNPSRRCVVLYPCRNCELLNFVCIVPDTSLKATTTESLSPAGDLEELLASFTGYPEWVIGVLKLAKDIKLWQLRDQDLFTILYQGTNSAHWRCCTCDDSASRTRRDAGC